MSKIKTQNQLLHCIQDDFAWRHQEIMNFRTSISASKDIKRNTLIRGGVAICYAHWEGYIKSSTEMLISYISNQKHKNNELADIYLSRSMKTSLDSFIQTKEPDLATNLVNKIINDQEKRANLNHKNFVNTESNLSSTVFNRIAKSVGVNVERYKDIYPFIDEQVLNKRNAIAHGEILDINPEDFNRISERVLDTMRWYKTDLEDIAVNKSYLKNDN